MRGWADAFYLPGTPIAITEYNWGAEGHINDDNGSGFGDTSVQATGPDPDNVAAFAALRSLDGALTTMVINKDLSGSVSVTINPANFAGNGPAQVWQLTAANRITRLDDVPYIEGGISALLPSQSITLLVLPSQ